MKTSFLLAAAATVSAAAGVVTAYRAMLPSKDVTLEIDEVCEGQQNKAFQDAEVYMSPRFSPSMDHTVHLSQKKGDTYYTLSLEKYSVFTDSFEGVELRWTLHCREIDSDQGLTDARSYHLTFPRRALDMVLSSYLPFVRGEAASIRQM